MKYLLALIIALATLSASAQTFSIPLTNLPPALQAVVAETHQLHQQACLTNRADLVVPGYVYQTNTVVSVTSTNESGEPTAWATNTTVAVVETRMNLNAFCDKLAADPRFKQLFREAVRDACDRVDTRINRELVRKLRNQQ